MAVYSLLSALLGAALLSSVVVIIAHALEKGWLSNVPIELRYIALFVSILLVTLNGNQWVAGNVLFPALTMIAVTSVVIVTRRLTNSDRRNAVREGASLVAVQAFTLVTLFVAFQMHRYWLLEGPNHDSLFYYQGLLWASESPLFVGKEAVRELWALGVCGEGGPWIGYDCPLYRGGTYTVAAWTQYFLPRPYGNAVYFTAVYSSTMAWLACRLLPATTIPRWAIPLFAITVAFSTGIIGALINANVATVMGAAAFVLIVALAMRTDISPGVRYGLISACCALAAHVYAESIFYAGLFVSLLFLLELPRNFYLLRVSGIIRLIFILLLIVFGLGNVAVAQALSNLFALGEVAKGGEWFSWYIQHAPFFWGGSFIAGLLMGAEMPLIPIVLTALAITLFACVILLSSRQTRACTLALIGVTCLAVLYVESTSYQYGEHKIVHLLGPAWAFVLIFASARLMGWSGVVDSERPIPLIAKAGGGIILSCLILISAHFFVRSSYLLNSSRVHHGVDFGLPDLVSHIRPGETVLVDDSGWSGVEKFQKTHYLTFQLHHQGAEALLPNITSDSLRGGYVRGSRNDSLSQAKGLDWLVQSRGNSMPDAKFLPPSITPLWENADYRLFRIGDKPVAVASNGWYDCEPTHCWTAAPFEIETYVPQGKFELSVNFRIFRPPGGGIIKVSSGDGRVLATVRSSSEQVRIELPLGWSRLVFNSDWTVISPLDAGMSADQRKLFAAVQRVEIKPLQGQTEK